MSFEIHLYSGRAASFATAIYESNGTTEISLAANDVVRFKIGTNAAAPAVELESTDTLAGGSTLTFTTSTGDCVITLKPADFSALTAGVYDAELGVYDTSETAMKHAEYGVVHVHPTQLGDVDG